MRVMTLNINGIRAGERKGFFAWFLQQNVDVLCLQEIKAQADQIDGQAFHLPGYHRYLACAEKKGYSGVALYLRSKPEQVISNLSWPVSDEEGRYLHAEYPSYIVASLYLPSGTSGDVRQAIKFDYLDQMMVHIKSLKNTGKHLLLCGDWNIAHKAIDLKNWRANQKHSGFLPEERAWMDGLFSEGLMVDAFRQINELPDQYTWWSNRGNAWANNVGWRIDYHVVSPELASKVLSASICTDQRSSDHPPLTDEYSLE